MEWMQNSHVVTILGYIFQWKYCVHFYFCEIKTRLYFKMENIAKVRINCNGTNIKKLQYFDLFSKFVSNHYIFEVLITTFNLIYTT